MRKTDLLLLLLLSMLWGASSLLVRIIAPVIGISLSIGIRMLIAALILMLLSGLSGRFPDFKKEWKPYFFLGAFNILVPFGLATYAVMQLNASYASILGATIPLFTVAAARYWMNEKINFYKVAGIIISISGLIIFMGTNTYHTNASFWLAVVAALVGSFLYAVSSVYANIKFKCSSPLQTAAGQIMTASVMMLPFLFPNFQPVLFTPGILIPLLVLGVLNTAGGYILYFHLMARAGSVQASFVTILVPVFSVMWASIFLHERVTPVMLLGLALVVIGISLLVYKTSMRYAAVLKPIRGAKFYEQGGAKPAPIITSASSKTI